MFKMFDLIDNWIFFTFYAMKEGIGRTRIYWYLFQKKFLFGSLGHLVPKNV